MPFNEQLTPRVLQHILGWAEHCCKDENFRWSKWDGNIYAVVKETIKQMNKDNYYAKALQEKKEELCPLQTVEDEGSKAVEG